MRNNSYQELMKKSFQKTFSLTAVLIDNAKKCQDVYSALHVVMAKRPEGSAARFRDWDLGGGAWGLGLAWRKVCQDLYSASIACYPGKQSSSVLRVHR